jgi:TonB family protein
MTTMIADPPRKTTMGVGFEANRRRGTGETEAWKRAIGTKAIPARLALLPEAKPKWDRIGISAGAQLVALLVILSIPLLYPDKMKTALAYTITEIHTPMTMVPVAPPPPPPPPPPKMKTKAPVAPKPEPEPVKLNPKQQHVFITPKAVIQPKVQKIEAKAPDMAPAFEAAKIDTVQAGPKKPKEDVKMNNLSSGSAAPATVKAPVEKVQTGGFGDLNGVPGKGDPKKASNVNALGSPALPGGPGYGNGTGGDKGVRGTVQSTGFGNGTAVPPTGGKKGSVQTSGFGDQTAAAEAPKKKAAAAESGTTPVDILDKPKPEYTAEGRSLRIEGDVVLELVFRANGTVEINRVVSGLGHGLDETAVKAAKQIKFKPAKREGQVVDFPARVRIEFRLAY